jgi:uncharacterized membrane protein YesL
MSGVVLANSARPFIHTYKNSFVACRIFGSSFPYVRLALAKAYFAALHSSVNQGANVFPHLLGFLGSVFLISLTTPAANAYYKIYSSIALALASLLSFASSITFFKPVVKSGFAVKSLQSCAD